MQWGWRPSSTTSCTPTGKSDRGEIRILSPSGFAGSRGRGAAGPVGGLLHDLQTPRKGSRSPVLRTRPGNRAKRERDRRGLPPTRPPSVAKTFSLPESAKGSCRAPAISWYRRFGIRAWERTARRCSGGQTGSSPPWVMSSGKGVGGRARRRPWPAPRRAATDHGVRPQPSETRWWKRDRCGGFRRAGTSSKWMQSGCR